MSSSVANCKETFKIGYIEGGKYWIFDKTMDAVNKSLEKKGWLSKVEYLEKYHFSPGWDNQNQWVNKAEILMDSQELDLIICAGTDATASILKVNNNKTPVVAIGVTDPVGSGFVKNRSDSGIDNFFVRIVPDRFERMFKIFHDVVGFKNLGLIYPDTENGRKYTNLEAARKTSKNSGFNIIEYKMDSEKTSECLNALKVLKNKGMDAFFIPSLLCFYISENDISPLTDFLIKNNIPSFARNGSNYVKSGALMGFSTVDFSKRGDFIADKIIRILQGVSPRKLNMTDTAVPKISFNLKVAAEIGFDPPFDILAATDELYDEIE